MKLKSDSIEAPEASRGEAARLRVLEKLRLGGPAPRANLGRLTGLSPAWITAITRDLIEDGILIEVTDDSVGSAARPGRPGIRLGVNPDCGAAIGLWVGLNRLSMTLVDYSGAIVAEHSEVVPLAMLSAEALMDRLAATIRDFRDARLGTRRIVGLGVSFQGFVDQRARTVIWSPVTQARDLKLADGLEARLALPVIIDNDASAMAYAICQRDPTLHAGLTACIMIGDGVGLGLLRDRKLMRGARGGGNEFGHIRLDPGGPQCRCGARGCIEGYLADYAIYRDALAVADLPTPATGRQPSEDEMALLVARADAGDTALRKLLERTATPLAAGVTTLIHLFQPDNIVFCGPGVRARQYLEPAFRAELERQVIPELSGSTRFSIAQYTPSLLTLGIILQVLEAADLRLAQHGIP